MIKWKRTGKEVTAEGTTITYSSQDTPLIIESRRRHIPHSGRAGTWDHTTYCLVDLEKESPGSSTVWRMLKSSRRRSREARHGL